MCLGHQAIVEAFGGEIGQARELVHGKASTVEHDGRGLFEGLPQGFQAGRYHSLAAVEVPAALEVSATTADGEVMAVRQSSLSTACSSTPESAHAGGPDLCRNFPGR